MFFTVNWKKNWADFFSVIRTSRVLDEKSSEFLKKLVLVEISSKTRSFVDILISGHPIPYPRLPTFKILGNFSGQESFPKFES